jgi:hypothetical protein
LGITDAGGETVEATGLATAPLRHPERVKKYRIGDEPLPIIGHGPKGTYNDAIHVNAFMQTPDGGVIGVVSEMDSNFNGQELTYVHGEDLMSLRKYGTATFDESDVSWLSDGLYAHWIGRRGDEFLMVFQGNSPDYGIGYATFDVGVDP